MSRFLWDDPEFESEALGRVPTRRTKEAQPKSVPGATPESALSVSQLNQCVAAAIEVNVPKVWVAGEVSDYSRPRSGHIYLTLKDDASQIRGVVWRSTAERLGFELEDGQAVLCFGRVDVYAPRGSYQIVIEKLEPQGVGALQLAFRQLHRKLESEGLFAAERKKPIPPFPKRIGFVTSPSGAAIRDFLEIARRRWPGVEILVIPARVQGEGAAEDIAYGIALAHDIRPKLDILVVGRGGGSMEDLWCFNEELVVRAIARASIPTVSAVGHEIDVTLADLVADLRALTPSEAAERIIPSQAEIREWLLQAESRLTLAVRSLIDRFRVRLDALRQRPVLLRPEENLQLRWQRIDDLSQRAERGIERQLLHHRTALATISATVEALSPIRTLQRGYSICRVPSSDKIVRSSHDVQIGETIQTDLADGQLESVVQRIQTR